MVQVVDYSFARPDPLSLVAAGYTGVMRYLAPLPNKKVIDAAERIRLHAAGLAIGFVWQLGEQGAANGGYAQGAKDAQRAIVMAQSLGAPDGTVIYYVLEDPRPVAKSLWPSVFAYAQGVKDQGGSYRQGGYGSQALLESAVDQGLIMKAWQVGGWSTGESDKCALLQRSDAAANPPPGTDVNDVLQADWGQWLPTGQPQIGDDMPVYLVMSKEAPDPKPQYLTDWTQKWHVHAQTPTLDEIIYVAALSGHPIQTAGGGTPILLSQATLDEIPDAGVAGGAVPLVVNLTGTATP